MLMRVLRYQSLMTANIMNMPWSDFRDFQREARLGPWSQTPPSQPEPKPMPEPPPLTDAQRAMLVEESEAAERDALAEIG